MTVQLIDHYSSFSGARAAEPSSTPSAGCEPSRARAACAESCTRNRRRSGEGTALTTAPTTKCWAASSWTPETVHVEHCSSLKEPTALTKGRRACVSVKNKTLRSPRGSAQCLKTETRRRFCFYFLSHLREMDAETIIQLRKSRGFIMIPIYPSLSSTK